MKIKFSQIQKIKSSCETIKEVKLPIKTAYKLTKLLDNVTKEFTFYQAELTKIITTYAEKDENGQPMVFDGGNGVRIQQDKIAQANAELAELENLEIEMPDVVFKLEEFEGMEFSMEDLAGLIDLIEE